MFRGYRDVREIGEGGLGRVYRAVKESTGGIVAIKELREVPSASPAWHRARRELQAMLRLKGHPYVVSIEEIFEGPNGPCLVMEYLEGGSLSQRLMTSPLSFPEAVLVGQHVTQALGAAHEVGIVHRDVKPHNLLVGSFGQVKVADFGIAALSRESGFHTRTQSLTLAYASPEELDGEETVGPPADVYSFAATMSHLLTGRKPSVRTRSIADDLTALHPVSTPARPLIDALHRCLATDPSARPTMRELEKVLAACHSSFGTDAISRLGERSSTDDLFDDARTVARQPLSATPVAAFVEPTGADGAPSIGEPTMIRNVAEQPYADGVSISRELEREPCDAAWGLMGRTGDQANQAARPRARRRGRALMAAACVGALVVVAVVLRANRSPAETRTTASSTAAPTLAPLTTDDAVVTLTPLWLADTGAVDVAPPSGDSSTFMVVSASGSLIIGNAADGSATEVYQYDSDGGTCETEGRGDGALPLRTFEPAFVVRGCSTTLALLPANGVPFRWTAEKDMASRLAVGGDFAVTGHADGRVVIWNSDLDEVQSWQLPAGVTALAVSAQGRIIAAAVDGSVLVADVASGPAPLWSRNGDATASVATVGLSPDGTKFVVGYEDDIAEVRSWEGELLNSYANVQSAAFLSNDVLVLVTLDGARIAELSKNIERPLSSRSTKEVFLFQAGDRTRLVACSDVGSPQILSEAGVILKEIPVGPTLDCEFQASLMRLYAVTADGSVSVWAIDPELNASG